MAASDYVPNLSKYRLHPAGRPQMASAGFWLGGGGIDEAAFYAYGYPSPEGPGTCGVSPGEAFWDEKLGEFILPYEVVRTSADPEAMLRTFLETTYAAVADKGDWQRKSLEIPYGLAGRPYDVAAFRRR